MNYDEAFRQSSWLTLTWLAISLVTIVFGVLFDVIIGNGGIDLYEFFIPLYPIIGCGFCVVNLVFGLRATQISSRSLKTTAVVSITTLVFPVIVVLVFPF